MIGVFSILLLLFSSACELKRSNPLDPNGNPEVIAPPHVVGLTASASSAGVSNRYVRLTWTKNLTNTDGYYIYMGLAYNSEYIRIGTQLSPPVTDTLLTVTWIKYNMTPGDYYFKVSAYKSYGAAGTLEGPLSPWEYVRVPN